MFWWPKKHKIRRQQVRQQRAKTAAALRGRNGLRLVSWRFLVGLIFAACAGGIALLGENPLEYAIGQRIAQAVYARVDFQVPNPAQTRADREAARAATPSYYTLNSSALTVDRIRADLMWLYQAAADAEDFDAYAQPLEERGWPAEERAYRRFRSFDDMPEDAGRKSFKQQVDRLPLEREYVVRGQRNESREPRSTIDSIVLETAGADDETATTTVPAGQLVHQASERALRGSARAVARKLREYELQSTVEEIIFAAFKEQPTIVFNQDRTLEEMRRAEEATPEAMTTYEKNKPFISPVESGGLLGSEGYDLLKAHRAAHRAFLEGDGPEAESLRFERWGQRAGVVVLAALLSIGLLVYTEMHQRRIFEVRARTIAFGALMLGTLLAARVLAIKWPQIPELIYAPCLLSASVLAIVYPRRFAVGAMCITSVLVATAVHGDLMFLLPLLTGVAVAANQLDEIRSRTKLIRVGMLTALAIMIASAAGGLMEGQVLDTLIPHVLWAGGCALLAAFVVSGVLPFIERAFRVATSLTLLEWRDPTKPLLQLLAREAPGTYNHSLVLGTLAEAACERIGADGLLAQVGALYHDVGKIHKADYFVENQEGSISRHEKLAPTMSLLIILGHVKDGMEMAKEYKLPRVLHQFIAEHHGTTVVRYFHHIASEKQPGIASGKHDREVSEAEFRYAGPKPRTRESAVLMLCDGVEGAIRALNEPTAGRIESVVHQIIAGRLNDGQFSDCGMTMRDTRLVEESLVKSLRSIYHGRVAYPKAAKRTEAPAQQRKLSV
ncbi:MAG: HDIG domain-containing protein [Planctomycetes bacterium]|nr:HDIG domain-containing protein [Planctomycetota bacterium]